MTFEKLINLFKILDDGSEILVMDELYSYPKEVCSMERALRNRRKYS